MLVIGAIADDEMARIDLVFVVVVDEARIVSVSMVAGSGSMANMAKKVEIRNKFDKPSYHGSKESVIHLEALL
ncbi:hypothetical protein Ga0466249_005397 [Sporomusaceae bacterium BoRhaA]|uniref:hypothetical protein n=1 Tax=Pelorhabdus rhamnosifermentans TaxID=2772457 RepID=UPI001C061EF8|nr:hypothetical protein [Pelorhabdus rhamnosifermentans]MBU2704238.1 hypothetical protein [Pelorhabdus rhamnosifermentans]